MHRPCPEPNDDVLSALEAAFDLIAQLEDQHQEGCVVPESVWDLIACLDWSVNAPFN